MDCSGKQRQPIMDLLVLLESSHLLKNQAEAAGDQYHSRAVPSKARKRGRLTVNMLTAASTLRFSGSDSTAITWPLTPRSFLLRGPPRLGAASYPRIIVSGLVDWSSQRRDGRCVPSEPQWTTGRNGRRLESPLEAMEGSCEGNPML